jgi:hypothetical protein
VTELYSFAGSLKRNCSVRFVGGQQYGRSGAFLPEVVLAVLNCLESACHQADTSWTLLLPDGDRLISMVRRKAVLGRKVASSLMEYVTTTF